MSDDAGLVSITPDQLNILQRSQLLLQKLSQGATKRDFERLVKTIVPEVETTDDVVQSAAAPYIEQLQATQKKLDDFLAAQAEAAANSERAQAETSLRSAFERLRSKEGLTDEGEKTIREYMIERNIPDPEAAWALWEKRNPKPAVVGHAAWEPDSWNLRENAVAVDVEGLFRDPDLWGDKEAANVINEMRRASFGQI